MANIYNDSSEILRQATNSSNATYTNLVVQNLIAQNAAIDNLNVDQTAIVSSLEITNINNHNLLVAGVNGAVNGLNIGNNNDILISNGTDALWSNSLVLQDLQTNTLKIPTTTTGDLLVFDNNSQAQKLSVGSSGQFFISDGVNPTWNDLPDPLIVGGLQINNNLEITNFPNRTIITDNTGFVVSERMMYSSGIATINTTPSQIYGSATWNFTQNAWYSVKVQVNCSTNSQFYGDVKILTFVVGNVYSLMNPNTWFCDFTYNHTTTTGTYGIALENFTTTSGSANLSYSIRVERMPTPQIVL